MFVGAATSERGHDTDLKNDSLVDLDTFVGGTDPEQQDIQTGKCRGISPS